MRRKPAPTTMSMLPEWASSDIWWLRMSSISFFNRSVSSANAAERSSFSFCLAASASF
jgi:hypothetical protein